MKNIKIFSVVSISCGKKKKKKRGHNRVRGFIKSIRFVTSNIYVEGSIKMAKLNRGQVVKVELAFTADDGGAGAIQAGSVVPSANTEFVSIARDPDFPDDEKKWEVTALKDEQTEEIVSWHADGDPDANTQADIVITLSLIINQPNATHGEAKVVGDPFPARKATPPVQPVTQ